MDLAGAAVCTFHLISATWGGCVYQGRIPFLLYGSQMMEVFKSVCPINELFV